jgi:cytoskeletal protein CcmA (bactofilin family)
MSQRNGFDLVNGVEVPQFVINEDYTLTGLHRGTVIVQSGDFTLEGTLEGTLSIASGVCAVIRGTQRGSVSVGPSATVSVYGAIWGSTTVDPGAMLTIEPGGKLAGALTNHGRVVVRGVFGGSLTGGGELVLEGEGHIKEPTVRNGNTYYRW